MWEHLGGQNETTYQRANASDNISKDDDYMPIFGGDNDFCKCKKLYKL